MLCYKEEYLPRGVILFVTVACAKDVSTVSWKGITNIKMYGEGLCILVLDLLRKNTKVMFLQCNYLTLCYSIKYSLRKKQIVCRK